MQPDILSLLHDEFPPLWRGVTGALATVGALGTALIALPLASAKLLPELKETRLADFLPFRRLLDDGRTIECRNGTLVRCISIAGSDLSSAPAAHREARRIARKLWLDSMIDTDVEIRAFLIRDRINTKPAELPDNELLATILKRQAEGLGDLYRNRHCLMISTPGGSGALARLESAWDRISARLADYAPSVLTNNPAEPETGPLAFLARLISPVTRPLPTVPTGTPSPDVAELLTADAATFNGGAISFTSGTDTLHVAAIGIRRLGDTTDESFIGAVSTVACEMTIFTVVKSLDRPKAMRVLDGRSRWARIGRPGAASEEQYAEAFKLIEGSSIPNDTAHEASQVILLQHPDKSALASAVREVMKLAAQSGITVVREGIAAQASWFTQFPGFDRHPRSYLLYASNLATFVTFDRTNEGPEDDAWGKGPLATFRTESSSPHRFHLHVTDELSGDPVAHAMCIGPTRSGKSTLLQFLAACAQRHRHVRSYFFDRYNGVEIFSKAIGGSYINFHGKGDDALGMNPLQMADTPRNRDFLKLWLLTIGRCSDDLSVADTSRAVDSMFEYMEREDRSLTQLRKTGFPPNSPMRSELAKWIRGGQYGAIFDGHRDTIDLGTRHVAFDFTQILEDPILAPAVISYLMHRIRATIVETGSAALIVIDETEPMLRNEHFKLKMVKPMLQEFRKLNSAIVLCFQRPGAIDDVGMGDVVRGQCQTVFYFRNPQAVAEDYAGSNLNEQDWDFIRGARATHLKYAVLVKRITGESVILDIDFSSLGKNLRLLSSSSNDVRFARQLQAQSGGLWVPQFLEA